MKQILLALAMMFALGSVTTAAADEPLNDGFSVLNRQTSNIAPKLDATQPDAPIEAPIVDSRARAAPQSIQPDHQIKQSNRPHQPKKPSILVRIREFERRKNAWLKRTFLGR